MTFIKGTPGCPCCCNLIYNASTSGGQGVGVDLNDYDASQSRYNRKPASGGIQPLSGDYCLDHYHNLVVDFNAARTEIRKYSPKLPAAAADINYTSVYTLGSSERGLRIATVTDSEKIIFATHEAIVTTTFSFHEVGFDGTGATFLFSRTAGFTTPFAELRHMEVCRANGKLYYAMRQSSDTSRIMLYRCDLDGSSDTLIFDPGTGQTVISGYPFAIDNAGERLFIMHSRSGNRSSLITCDLDGGSQLHLLDTSTPVSPGTVNTGRSVRYSHKTQRVYWWQSQNSTSAPGNPNDATGGMWSCKPDGTDQQHHYGRYEISLGGANDLTACWEIGCGFEQLGTSSLA